MAHRGQLVRGFTSQGLSHLQSEAGKMGNTGAAPAPGIRDGLKLDWDVAPQVGPTWWGPWAGQGRAGQGCVELESGPAAASLGQGLMALGAGMGSGAIGKLGGATGTAGQGQSGLLVASGP